MEHMTIFYIVTSVAFVASLLVLLRVRKMGKYKIFKEKDLLSGEEMYFPKIRKGLSYYYLNQTHDAPGYENDIFEKSSIQCGGQEKESHARDIIYNHKMTVVTGKED